MEPFICMGMEKEIRKNFSSGLAGYLKAGEGNHNRPGSCLEHVARRWRAKNRDESPLTRMPAVEESAWPEMAYEDTEPGGIMIMLSY